MRNDFENIRDGERVKLYPNRDNPLHSNPVICTYADGYFFCDGSPTELGPDYYFGDVAGYNDGFEFA